MKSVLLAGVAAHHLGKTELADKHLTAYLQRFPDNVYARKLLAANQVRANEPAQALQLSMRCCRTAVMRKLWQSPGRPRCGPTTPPKPTPT